MVVVVMVKTLWQVGDGGVGSFGVGDDKSCGKLVMVMVVVMVLVVLMMVLMEIVFVLLMVVMKTLWQVCDGDGGDRTQAELLHLRLSSHGAAIVGTV